MSCPASRTKQNGLAYRVYFTFLFVPQILEQNRDLLPSSSKGDPGFEKGTVTADILDFIGLELLCFPEVSSSTVIHTNV